MAQATTTPTETLAPPRRNPALLPGESTRSVYPTSCTVLEVMLSDFPGYSILVIKGRKPRTRKDGYSVQWGINSGHGWKVWHWWFAHEDEAIEFAGEKLSRLREWAARRAS